MDKSTLLLILLFVCHWLGDFTHLSRPFMLAAKRTGKPLGPILLHALVHAMLVFHACLLFVHPNEGIAAQAMVFQFITHATIDVLKGRCNVWFPALTNPTSYGHWYVFGFDQFLHALVHILTVAWVL